MSDNTTSTRRRNALIAAGAAAVLLLGGSTYALWSATATLDGGQITAGNLELVAGTNKMWDISEDRTDVSTITVEGVNDVIPLADVQGHPISDPETWRIVPGDTVLVTLPFAMTLEGDNLVAKLTLDPSSVVDMKTFTETYLPEDNITWGVFDNGGTLVSGPSPLPTNAAQALGYFQAPETGQEQGAKDGDIPFVNAKNVADTTGDGVLALWITFDLGDDSEYTQEQVDTSPALLAPTYLKLSEKIALSLQQVRCGGVFVSTCS